MKKSINKALFDALMVMFNNCMKMTMQVKKESFDIPEKEYGNLSDFLDEHEDVLHTTQEIIEACDGWSASEIVTQKQYIALGGKPRKKYGFDVTKILDIPVGSLPEELEQKIHKWLRPTFKENDAIHGIEEHLFSVSKLTHDQSDEATHWVQDRLNEKEQSTLKDIVAECEEKDCAYIRFII